MSEKIDPKNFKPAIIYTIYIASPPEKVWQALTNAEFSRKYFSGFAIEADLKVGGAFIARAPDGSVHIRGEVIECDPPKAPHRDLERELAGAGGKARADARDLRDRARGRRNEADDAAIARPRRSATTSCPAGAPAGPRSSPA